MRPIHHSPPSFVGFVVVVLKRAHILCLVWQLSTNYALLDHIDDWLEKHKPYLNKLLQHLHSDVGGKHNGHARTRAFMPCRKKKYNRKLVEDSAACTPLMGAPLTIQHVAPTTPTYLPISMLTHSANTDGVAALPRLA